MTTTSAGAAWVFTRSGGVWTQQGTKLVGTGAVGAAQQGVSVALSADGNTAIVGGPADNSSAGAAWVFTRSGGVWTQQGTKLVGTGAVGAAQQGDSVALSGDGNTAIVGGWADNNVAGAAWVFMACVQSSLTTHNFNADCTSDIAWREAGGTTAAWLINRAGAVLQAGSYGVVPTTWSIVAQRDFNGDGTLRPSLARRQHGDGSALAAEWVASCANRQPWDSPIELGYFRNGRVPRQSTG